MGNRLTRSLSLCVLLAASVAAAADDYREARAELVAAYQVQNYPAMVVAAERALAARPGHPGGYFNLALAHALNDEPEFAMDKLSTLAAFGIDFGIEEMDEFAGLRELPGWPNYVAQAASLHAPKGSATTVLTLDDGAFVPEGIAIDDDGRIYLGSIRKGLLQRGDEILSHRDDHWSVFGMRFHDDGSLWFASAAVAQLEDVGDDLGKTGLFRLNVDSGEITRAAILPQHHDQQVLGDLVIDGDTIYTTDSLTGGVYRYDIKSDTFSMLVEPGVLRSPQGLVLDASGRYLFVADYADGIFRVALSDGKASRLAVPGAVAIDYGIDGLYRQENHLIAIQNGIRPHRVVAFELAEEGDAIVSMDLLASSLPEFDEPTLGAVHGDALYFVANSHWNRFDRENRLPEGLTGPIILKLDLAYSE